MQSQTLFLAPYTNKEQHTPQGSQTLPRIHNMDNARRFTIKYVTNIFIFAPCSINLIELGATKYH